jgi:2'-5' RNA ligase
MHKQLSLFETPQPHQAKYSLFLAAFPDHHTAQQIINLGNTLRQIHAMHGRLRPFNHLHVSLLFLGGASEVPETFIETVGHICKAVVAVTIPFEIKFDRVLSFRGRPGNHPLVLVENDHGNDGVRNLQGLLFAEFSKYFSLPVPASKFVPHLTLLYEKQERPSTPVEPVGWTVREIVLVRSEVGATKYDWLGRWRLGE